jgi:ABC-type branched-subunit amino acid transport system substrate-binding protein
MASAYDDVNILADAVTAVGTDTEKIKNYLYQLPQYFGLLGDYHFDANGDVVGINFVVKHIINGVIN